MAPPGSTKKKKKKKKKGVKGSPVAKLTDDILVEIFSRVPYKSICCCKCVSTRWRDLFFHPDHRKKLPQTLAGFFHKGYNKNRFPSTAQYFTNVSGEGDPLVCPSLSFLPNYSSLDILDYCNGLLLCQCRKTSDYVVCNPATEKWVDVPASEWSSQVNTPRIGWSEGNAARIGFDPAVSSHFHVFEFIDEEAWGIPYNEQNDCFNRIEALAIYSSKTGVWKHQNLDGFEFAVYNDSRSVFFNGILHVPTLEAFILAIDVERNDWGLVTIPMPRFSEDDVFLSQRQLCIACFDESQLSIRVLENYKSKKWTLKHNVSILELFGVWYSTVANHYSVIAFHPERNMIFMVCGNENTLMSYDMDCRKMCFICQLGRDCQMKEYKTPYLPYVPLYSEPLADGY